MSSDPTGVEFLVSQLGTSGKYQSRQHILHFITSFLAGMHMFSLTFIAPTPLHRCLIPEIDIGNTTSFQPLDMAILLQYLPVKADGELDSCRRYVSAIDDNSIDGNFTSGSAEPMVASCNGQFVYDTSIYQQSRVYDWDMVCENKWKRAFIQSIYVFGVFSGALFCGSLADRFGRKMILCTSGILQFLFAMIQPYMGNYALYCITLYFYGMFGSAGAMITAYVLTMELVHKSNRACVGAIFNSCFAVGACFVAIWAYFIKDIAMLQTIYALHALILVGYWWMLDESIRWLWSQGRVQEAIDITRQGVKINNNGPFSVDKAMIDITSKPRTYDKRSHGFLDLFRFPTTRLRMIITAFNWFAVSLCFYGLAFNTGALPGDPYIVFFISSFVDLPGFFIITLIQEKLKPGRRSLSATLLLVGGLSCIVTTIIPRGWILTTVAMVAKIALAACFTVIYNFTAELFPTVVRNSAVGLCSMASRFGGTLTPQIALLTFVDKRIPSLIFGSVAICAAIAGMFLPETLNKELPQSLEDGEEYGKGDTAFNACFKSKRKNRKHEIVNEPAESKNLC